MLDDIEDSAPKNILFLTDRWFSTATANAVCVNNIAQVLIQDGWTVYVSSISDGDATQKVANKVHIDVIKTPFYKRLLKRAEDCKGTMYSWSVRVFAKFLYLVKRFFLLPIYPVGSPLFARKWGKRVCQLIDQYKISIVISVDAPQESIYTGYLIKKEKPNIKWAIYYLDSGTNVLHGASFEKLKILLQNKAIKWEKHVFQYAEKVFVMQGHADYYRKNTEKQFWDKLEFVDVPLFCSNNRLIKTEKIKRTEKWVYTGSLTNRYYDPHIICELFTAYKNQHDAAQLDLYGRTDEREYLNKISQNYRSGICWYGTVPHESILGIFARADIFVYYQKESLDSVSGKFFEYIATGKPVIYIGHVGDINYKLVTQYPLGCALNIEDDTEIKVQCINNFFDRLKYIQTPDYECLKKKFRLSLPETTARLMEGML